MIYTKYCMSNSFSLKEMEKDGTLSKRVLSAFLLQCERKILKITQVLLLTSSGRKAIDERNIQKLFFD